MILADTSVWISYLNGTASKECNALDLALAEGTVGMGDIIYLEVLQGIRCDKEFRQTKRQLAKLDLFELFGRESMEKCATNYRYLRKNGITIRSSIDVIIATYCIENKLPLLFSDKNFLPFVEYLNLTSFLA